MTNTNQVRGEVSVFFVALYLFSTAMRESDPVPGHHRRGCVRFYAHCFDSLRGVGPPLQQVSRLSHSREHSRLHAIEEQRVRGGTINSLIDASREPTNTASGEGELDPLWHMARRDPITVKGWTFGAAASSDVSRPDHCGLIFSRTIGIRWGARHFTQRRARQKCEQDIHCQVRCSADGAGGQGLLLVVLEMPWVLPFNGGECW